jgi:TonB family protein
MGGSIIRSKESVVRKNCIFFTALSIVGHLLFFCGLFFWTSRTSLNYFVQGGSGKGSSLMVDLGTVEMEGASAISQAIVPPRQKSFSIREEAFHPPLEKIQEGGSTEKSNLGHSVGEGKDGSGGEENGPSSSGSGSGANSSSLLSAIRAKIEHSKRYPPMARAQQIEGVVGLIFLIDPRGEIKEASLIKSSGSSLLDEEGLATVRRAAPFPFYPNPIRISLKFSLENE